MLLGFLEIILFLLNGYEDKIKGTISEERFIKMSQGFENEQAKNKKRIEQLAKEMKNQNREIDTTKMFLDIVEKTTHLEKLTADVVREFIDKIVVHHRQESGGVTTQKVEIYYNVIGKFEIPPMFAEQEQKATA